MGDSSVPDNLPKPHLLGRIEDIDSDWLQRLFQHADIDAPKISLVNSAGIGAGNLSDTVRTGITYNADAADFPSAVICKFHPQAQAAAEACSNIGAGRREVETYQLLSSDGFEYMPELYFGACNESGSQF